MDVCVCVCLCVYVRLCAAYHLLVLYKDRTGRLGMSMASVNGSILVNYVQPSSPAELAGLKFGDEIASVSVSAVVSHRGTSPHGRLLDRAYYMQTTD